MFPLHHAVENNASLDVIKLLVEAYPAAVTKGYFIRDKSPSDRSALIVAPSDPEKFEYLLEQAISFLQSTQSKDSDAIDEFFFQHYRLEDVMARFLNQFPDFPRHARQFDLYAGTCKAEFSYPLHFAVMHKAPIGVLRRLISCFPEALTAKDLRDYYNTDTPLHKVCVERNPDVEVIKLLASPEAARVRDSGLGRLALHAHLRRGDARVDIVRILVQAYPESLKEVENDGNTPLNYFLHSFLGFNFQTLQFLVESAPDAVNQPDNQGFTPLHWATRKSLGRISFLVIHYLITKCPGLATSQDNTGRTPLHVAVEECDGISHPYFPARDEGTVECLLEVYPEAIRSTDNEGRTPLMLACERNVPLSVIYRLLHVDPISNVDLMRGQTGFEPLIHERDQANGAAPFARKRKSPS